MYNCTKRKSIVKRDLLAEPPPRGTMQRELSNQWFGGGGETRMDRGGWQVLVDQLRGTEYQFGLIAPGSPVHRVEFDAGLTDAEVAAVEGQFGFRFPPDLREFLQ